MLYSQIYIKDAVLKLRIIVSTIKETTDIDPLRSKIYGHFFEMALACEESWFTLNIYKFREVRDMISVVLEFIRDNDEPLPIKARIEEILDKFEENELSNYSIQHFTSNVSSANITYRTLQSYNVEKIAKSVFSNYRNVNILDPRCRDGINVKAFKDSLSPCTVYGIESDPTKVITAKTNIDRVATGTLYGSKISNDAFDVVFLELPVSWQPAEAFFHTKVEKSYLQDTLKYLREGGLGIYILPYFRMYKDMCVFFAKNFKNVQVRKLAGADFFDKGLVAITGYKNYTREPDEDTYHMLRRLYKVEEIPDIMAQDFDRMQLPIENKTIDLFRGSVLDTDEMKNIVDSSGCLDAFWQSQTVEKLSDTIRQPLLPFNIGQIGLVLTSGCLDGIIDEGDGNFHVIKGRVSKKSTTERNGDSSSSIEVVETISNRVEINVLLPNGEHKVLA